MAENQTPSMQGSDPLDAKDASAAPPSAMMQNSAEDDAAISAYKTIEARKRRKRRRKVIAGITIAVLLLGALGWFAATQLMSPQESEGPAYELEVATIMDFETSVSASGSIKPASQVVVTPEVEGIIQDVRVAEGDSVSKGDVLFTLRNNALDKAVQDAEQAVKSAENGVVQAQHGLTTANNALANAQTNYDRVFSTGFETQEEADAAGQEASDALVSAENALDTAQLAVEDAQIALTNAQDALQLAQDNANKRTVTAPEAGTIIAMSAETGASTGSSLSGTSGSGGSLVTIADLSSLRVRVEVNEVDINNLSEGQAAEVTFSALPDVMLQASVERIAATSATANENYGGSGIVTYDVDLIVPNPDPHVKPGMTARVKILTKEIKDALTIPTAAITFFDDMQTEGIVMVATDADQDEPAFEERSVRVVANDGTTAVVEGDLAEGDEVQISYLSDEDESAWTVSVG